MNNEPVKIGVLFSETGPMAITENASLQGTMLACDEINRSGGISGRPIEPVILNPDGVDLRYAELATDLLLKHRVDSVFGCCLSTSRKAVLPIIERFNGVLFYPSVYEGFEYSPNVIYGGAVPNQTILPLLEYIFRNLGPKVALIGSDTLYSREINRIVSEFVASSGGEIVSERYLPFCTELHRIESALTEVSNKTADVILSTVVGGDIVALYSGYAGSGLEPSKTPIASLTTTESELAKVDSGARSGHLSVSPYFAALETRESKLFMELFQQLYGDSVQPSVYSEVCYSLVHMYANAVRLRGSTQTESVLEALSGAVFKGPGGDLSIDPETNHFTLRPNIGRSNESGGFDILWTSPSVIRPDPYLVSYDRTIRSQVNA